MKTWLLGVEEDLDSSPTDLSRALGVSNEEEQRDGEGDEDSDEGHGELRNGVAQKIRDIVKS
jgi:hypothetical protein